MPSARLKIHSYDFIYCLRGSENCSVTLRDGHRLWMFEKKVLKKRNNAMGGAYGTYGGEERCRQGFGGEF